jgi:hypothetical protein
VKRLSRRQLAAASAAAVVLVATGLGALRASGYRAVPAARLKTLTPWQYVVVEAVGARIVAPERLAVGPFIDDYCAGLYPEDLRDLKRFLAYVEHLAPLGAGHLRRFSSLGAAAQDQVLSSLETSAIDDLRAGFQALKALVLMDLYRRNESWAAIGYDGPAKGS